MQNIYLIIAPIALVLLVLEIVYCVYKKNEIYTFQECFTNISTGVGNQLVNLVVMGFVFSLYQPLYEMTPLKIEYSLWSMVLLLILVDFIFYWIHRFGHSINFMWAAHSPHHSGEEMNLALALRASVTMRLMSFFFFWPLAFLGFSPQMIYAASGIQLIIAFWHHTKLIDKMGWFETVFNSPSHHRVHHGTNAKYLDKNFGEIFIIWDKMFGTFQSEEEEVNYGILRHPKSWNPLIINFHFWGLLFSDFKETRSWWNKVRIWFMPLGWRPGDVTTFRAPVVPYEVGEYKRYKTQAFAGSKAYLIFQISVSLLVMLFALDMKNSFTIFARVLCGLYIWAGMMSWGAILESRNWGLKVSFGKEALFILSIIALIQHFNLSEMSLNILISVCSISFLWTALLYQKCHSLKNEYDV
jgi:sterol desaturase/sphingolipid hydroxylase (fatty acid hydroxylase superfamily)